MFADVLEENRVKVYPDSQEELVSPEPPEVLQDDQNLDQFFKLYSDSEDHSEETSVYEDATPRLEKLS